MNKLRETLVAGVATLGIALPYSGVAAAEAPVTTVTTETQELVYDCPGGYQASETDVIKTTIKRFSGSNSNDQITTMHINKTFENLTTGYETKPVTSSYIFKYDTLGKLVMEAGLVDRDTKGGTGLVDAGSSVFTFDGQIIRLSGPSDGMKSVCERVNQ